MDVALSSGRAIVRPESVAGVLPHDQGREPPSGLVALEDRHDVKPREPDDSVTVHGTKSDVVGSAARRSTRRARTSAAIG